MSHGHKFALGISLILLVSGCSSWERSDRENFMRNCAASLDRQFRGKYAGQQANLFCTCMQSETEARFLPNQTGELPPVVIDNCARKANLDLNR